MTKLKNTKKGMAKKALSISLVAAMLATSNVPIWAAEDLFSDGSAAVEAPAVEEPVAEVDTFSAEPVEENNTSAILESSTSGNQYSAAITAFQYNGKDIENNSIVWGEGDLTTTLTVTKNSDIDGIKDVYAVWKAGNDVVTEPAELIDNGNGTYTLNCRRTIGKDDANKSLSLYVYAQKEDGTHAWTYTSDSISVQAKDISSVAKASVVNNPEYKGSIIKPTIKIESTSAAFALPSEIDTDADYTIGYDGDRVNVTGEKVVVTLTPKSSAYKGSLTATYEITSKTLADNTAVSNVMQAKFKNTTMKYNGGKDSVKVLKDNIELIDKTSKSDLSNYMVVDENGYVEVKKDSTTGSYCIIPLIKGLPDNGNKNYEIIGTNAVIVTSNVLEVVSRDLSSLDITINPIQGDGAVVTVEDIKNNITIVDKETKENLTGNLKNELAISIPTNAVNAGTYTVTIEPLATVSKLTGKATVTLKIFASNINDARFVGYEENGEIKKPIKYYTGEAVTFSQDEIGVPKINGTPLKDSDYTIEYSNNIKAGTAKMFVIGQDSYANSIKTLKFTINKTPVTSVSRNQYVEKIDTTDPEDYKTAMGVVVKAKVPGTNKELTLVEGTDYTVKYSFADDKTVQAVVTLKADGNFDNPTAGTGILTVESEIVNATLKPEYIKLKEGSTFTYTGQAIEPAFDVVIGGRIIDSSKYTTEYTNNVDAGTATLTIKGDDINYQGTASITYTIQSAKSSDLVGVIGTQAYRGYSIDIPADDIDLTLNGKKIDVAKNFTLTYGENLNIGEGTVTLTPKNSNFTGTKTLTFQITGEMLESNKATFAYRDANGFAILDANKSFNYNGSAQTFAKTTLTYTGKTLKEGTDYELVYVDNVYGQKGSDDNQYAAVLAVAKGKYGGNMTKAEKGIEVKDGIYTDAEGNKTVNVFAYDLIKINQQPVEMSNVTVSNGTYAAGLPTKPEVSIVVKGVKLVEGKDYELDLSGNKDIINATTTKSLSVKIEFKNGYKAGTSMKDNNNKTFSWGIDKFNLANSDVTVDGDNVTVKCGNVVVPSSEYTVAKDASADTVTVTATKDNKNYTGSKTVSAVVEDPDEAPAAPVIQSVNINGNNATVVLSGESDGATGYDYVISTDRDCITTKDYDKVNKNILTTNTTFTYTQQGVYYAYCHAWKRVDGEKVFSDWSAAYPFVVSSITPEQPSITKVEKSSNGKHLRITWTKSANAIGYDVVMGTKLQKVNGEYRPVEYGKAVKKVTNGNTVSVIFYNIPKGTYYVGLHAYNRSSESGVKVFSQWSNSKKVTF